MAQPRILIFADDPRLCRLLVGEAEAAGFEGVATSERGKFEDHYRNTTPDLIFMEIDEPLAEVERFLELASAHPGGRLMLLSGVDEPRLGQFMVLASTFGVNIAGVLHKPMGLDAIRTALRHHAGNIPFLPTGHDIGNQP